MQRGGRSIADVAVIGAGMVGAAIAYGLAKHDLRVLVLDGGDRELRAATANFGLVWLQGKGLGMPAYQQLTRDSVDLWPEFITELGEATAVDCQYERNGGLTFCLGEQEFEEQRTTLLRLDNELGGTKSDWEMLDRSALAKLMPKVPLGPDVTGASFGLYDGHANPLRLLTALHLGLMRRGAVLLRGSTVHSVLPEGRTGFTIGFGTEHASVGRVVIAAGLGSKPLAAEVGLQVPIHPQRGQILVTERLDPLLPLPSSGLRQTQEGTVVIGATHEESGFDTSTTGEAAAALSAEAVRKIPSLSEATLVRQWAGLRILTPDGNPVYAESQSYPGAFVAVCHSALTLAAIHSTQLADAIASGRLSSRFDAFHQRRFDVPKAA